MLRCVFAFIAAVIAGPVLAAVPQPNWIAGVYTIAAGPSQLPSAAANAFYIAWAVDRPGSAGFMVSDGSAWTANAGPTGATGANGANGTNGNSILSGVGVPSAGQGVDGDFYVDLSATRLYGPKTSGVWGSGVSLVGPTGSTGPQGDAGVNAFGMPNTRTLSLATAYQATTTTKPAVVTVNLTSSASLSLSGGTTNSATVVIGSTNAVASGTGTSVCQYSNASTGTLTIGLNTTAVAASSCTFALPTGWFWAVRQTAGTVTITSAFDQSTG